MQRLFTHIKAGCASGALVFTLVLSIPRLARAEALPDLSYLNSASQHTITILAKIIPLAVTAALIFFFWGLTVFIFKAGEPEERAKGRQRMIWGIVALTVIISVWGLVALLSSIFNVKTGHSAPAPSVGNLVR